MAQAILPQQGTAVSDLRTRRNAAPARPQGGGPAASVSPAFSSLVAQMVQRGKSDRPKTVEDLMAQLDDEERDFAEAPSRERFESYRKTVKQLCSMLLNRGYRLQGWEDKRKRRYEVIKIIDSRLAQLYTGLLRRNQDVVIALHLMGQIRGLIFDLKA
jgi:uncharacterized protein YaaR (DUF327 family)